MKNNLKDAFFQGALVFILAFISTSLITPLLLSADEIDKIPSLLLIIILFTLSLGLVRGFSVYFYKKNVIEDERLIAVRQRTHAIWFIITLNILGFTPFFAILYANYISNPILNMFGYFITLEGVARTLMAIVGGWMFLILIGGSITQKILMRSHEK